MDRPTVATSPPARPQRRPLPPGATKWATVYVGHRGLPETARFPVPVDENDQRTQHVRYTCRGRIEVDRQKLPCDRDEWMDPADASPRFCPDHGCLLTADAARREPRLPWSAMWHAAEKPLRPAWVLAAEAAAGLGMHVAGLPPLDAFLAGGIATAGAYVGTRRYLTRRAIRLGHIEEGQTAGRRMATIQRRARTAGYIGTYATAWLTAATSVDPTSALGRIVWASLPVAWAVSAAPWWRYLEADRNRPAPVVASVEPEAEPTDDALAAAQGAEAWARDVGFAHTELDPATWQRTVAGWQAVVVARKKGALVGLTDVERMRTTKAKIAAGYGVKMAAVTWIGEHDDDPNKALLLIQPNNPLSAGQIWEGPGSIDMERGVAISGRRVDGTPLVEVLYRRGWGAPNRVSLGTTGGGKSERVRQRLIIERWAHFTDPDTGSKRGAFISILHDPKDMDAYGEFMGALPAYGTTRDDGHRIVDALIREMDRRYAFKRSIEWKDRKERIRFGAKPWDPAIHGPIISSIWDEFHELAGDQEFVKKLERLARKQRACGMTFEVLSHGGTIGDMGSQVLRDLGGGITTLFRTKNALNAALTAGGIVMGDPRTLPTEPGMCFVTDGQNQSSMMARGSWIPGDEDAHEVTLYDWLFDQDNNPIGYPAEIPAETAEAFGTEFMEWAEAGRRPGGRDVVASPSGVYLPTTAADDLTAADALRRILLDAGTPLSRTQIAESPGWGGRGVTSTLTKALRSGQDAVPPWLVKLPRGNGVYELTAAVREQMSTAADEVHEDLAA